MIELLGSLIRPRLISFGLKGFEAYKPRPNAFLNLGQRSGFANVKTISKSMRRFLIKYQEARLEGREFDVYRKHSDDNEFYKVINGMKVFKPITNGLRNRRVPIRFHLFKGRCIHRLSFPRQEKAGRNKTGRITTRHRGGGRKTRMRFIDFYRTEPGPHTVVRLEYDPNRSAEIALLQHKWTNEYSYIIRPKDLNVGDEVESFISGIPEFGIFSGSNLLKESLFKPGNCFKIKDIPPGSYVHCVGLVPDGSAVMCRSAGSSAKIIGHKDGNTIIQVPSKESRIISSEACAAYGVVGNELHRHRVLGKAGINRHLGVRPTVRGIKMNACDHPNGGGSGNKKKKQLKNVYGKLARGVRSVRKYKEHIVVSRRRYKMLNRAKS